MPTQSCSKSANHPVSHIFICVGWQVYVDMFPFFEAIRHTHDAFFFTDVTHEEFSSQVRPITELLGFSPPERGAVVYFSVARHYAKYVTGGTLGSCATKMVKISHGITGNWSRLLLKRRDFIDVVIAASNLDADTYRNRTSYRVETIGWPRAEAFLKLNSARKIDEQTIVVSSSWSRDKGDFRICDRIAELADHRVTFMLHPVLTKPTFNDVDNLDPDFVGQQLEKLKGAADVVQCEQGALPHMLGKETMLCPISATAYEWVILGHRPIWFLRPYSELDFGRNLEFDKPLLAQIEAPEPAHYGERRQTLRDKLTSHFDGRWSERFVALMGDMESALLR